MPLYRAFLQTLGAFVLLAVALACGGKSSSTTAAASTTVLISGTVTYKRVPLAKDAQGVPTGLVDATDATKLVSLPARGAMVRIYQQVEETQPNGSKTQVWTISGSTMTDTLGAYSATVTKDLPTMVELLSTFDGGGGIQIHVDAEPTGISSTTGVLNRLRYSLRKAADGTTPAGVVTPSSKSSADAKVDFTVGVNDVWWVIDPAYNMSTGEASQITQATLETSYLGRTAGLGTGSRILGIGDTIASFVAVYGAATPGATIDLHYWLGRSEALGSFIQYDRNLYYPQAWDATTQKIRFFGSLRGASSNDDAWDEGVIMPLLARNVLYGSNSGRTYSVPLNPMLPAGAALTNLVPDMARIEGLADAMAANVLKTPYLADTNGTLLAVPLKDIRDITGLATLQLSPYSAPALRALAWQIILKANSLASPGVAADWANINPLGAARLFYAPAAATNGATDATARDIEPLNIYTQLKRLSEVKTGTEPADLAAIFTDAVLTPMTATYGITWPRPTTGTYSSFVADWGTDPTGALPAVTLSMAKAERVNSLFPNLSQGEVFYTGFSLNLNVDKRWTLSATIAPALSAGAWIEVELPMMTRSFTFSGAGGVPTDPFVLPVNNTVPYYHSVRVRLRSASTAQPDVTVTLRLTPSN